MSIKQRVISLLLAIVLCINFLPLIGLSTPIQADGGWKKDSTNPVSNPSSYLGSNNNSIVVEASDPAGNTGSSGTRNEKVDVNKPEINWDPFSGLVLTERGLKGKNNILPISGTVTGASLVTIRINGKAIDLSIQNGTDIPFSSSVTLNNGLNIISLSAYSPGFTDEAHLGTAGSRSVILNTQAPEISFFSPIDKQTVNVPNIMVVGMVNDPAVNSIQINGTEVAVNNGNFSQSIGLQAGDNTIIASVTDQAGNSSTRSIAVKYDSSAPLVTIVSPANNLFTKSNNLTINGTINDISIQSATLKVNNVPSSIPVISGVFNVPSGNLIIGEAGNGIEVSTNDGRGRSGVIHITIDNKSPRLTIELGDPSSCVNIAVSSDEDLSDILTVKVNPPSPISPYVMSMTRTEARRWVGNYGSTDQPIQAGNYSIVASGTDKAGNTASASAGFDKNIVTVNSPTDIFSGNVTLHIQTTAEVDNADLSITQTNSNPSGNVGNPEGVPNPIGVFIDIDASSDLRNHLDSIEIRINYDPNSLPTGTDENSLRLYYWNINQGIWQEVKPGGVNTSQHYIYGTATQLSQYSGFGANISSTVVNPPVLGGGGGPLNPQGTIAEVPGIIKPGPPIVNTPPLQTGSNKGYQLPDTSAPPYSQNSEPIPYTSWVIITAIFVAAIIMGVILIFQIRANRNVE